MLKMKRKIERCTPSPRRSVMKGKSESEEGRIGNHMEKETENLYIRWYSL